MSDAQQDLTAFMRYAAAFEEGFAADDWGLVNVLFDDAVAWAVDGLPAAESYLAQGRDRVTASIKRSVDAFDRRFDRREPAPLRPPVAIPGGIHLEWQVTYTRVGIPAFVLRGEEWDLFHDGKLAMHYERIHNGAEALAYLTRHHQALLPPRQLGS
ncbi:MAG TPA: hypothetical protein VGK30_05745 [Candidatus Binatia bacterium]|jgi:hypothetical protein